MVLQTLLLYILLTVLLYIAAKQSFQRNTFVFVAAAVFCYAVIFGLRSGVGVDFWGYKGWYNDAMLGLNTYDHIEPGFKFLLNASAALRLPFSFFLFLIAFLQLILVFAALSKFKSVYKALAITFMLGCVWLTYANGLRQQLAFCIFAYSLQFVADRKLFKYFICVVLASLFHTSAVILVLIYPLFAFKEDYFKRIWVQFGLLTAALVISQYSLASDAMRSLEGLGKLLGYDVYFKEEFELTEKVRIGLGFYINLLIDIVLVFTSTKVKKFYNNRYVMILYSLFFIGVLWYYVFLDSLLLQRINYYFIGFKYIYAAFAINALVKSRDLKYLVICLLYFAVFVATMYRMEDNTALFMFNWQNSLL